MAKTPLIQPAPARSAAVPASGQRLSKRLAAQLPCSRSDAERHIAAGSVRVDGVPVELPQARVRDEQTVTIDAQARPPALAGLTLLWHKPAGQALPTGAPLPEAVAALLFAPEHRCPADRSGLRVLQAQHRKLLPLAALQPMASGLMAFTQNPGVARKLLDEAAPIEHEWLLEVAADPGLQDPARRAAVCQSLAQPLFFNGRALACARASWQSELRLRLAIKGTLAGQVEHLAERAGLRLNAVRRLRLGRVALAGLVPGQWRYLCDNERF